MKSLYLFKLLWSRPEEVLGRIEGILDSRLERLWRRPHEYKSCDLSIVVQDLQLNYNLDTRHFLDEKALLEIEKEVRLGIERLPRQAPFARIHNGDFAFARLSYALCRARRPKYIVETGVCYGVTTAFLLKALDQNGYGRLHSIDLPPLGLNVDKYVGVLVPEQLRRNWQLYRGTSKAILPSVLKALGTVDMFIHDSLHTYRNMHREFETVTPFLSESAVLLSDDIEGNKAFQDWIVRACPRYQAVLREDEKSGLAGLGILSKSNKAATVDDLAVIAG